ncbi:hypothetical protein CF15_06980 [Pyrodictium occultum]|uniref:Uncharacterized protein n=1 Tax=Pyrodictium occultum TaxID=2309 RepID=A0A0V8RXH9_PYROC|nr:hypothetical protein [Pyrodictium occultum]KSW12774.1 hypothetical protein CF15_06980 [Pyrodictium occultum]
MASEYLSKLKDLIKPKAQEKGIKVMVVGSTMKLVKDGNTVMNIADKGEIVELSFKGKKYTYDKWYTKPEHLAATITRTLDVQL